MENEKRLAIAFSHVNLAEDATDDFEPDYEAAYYDFEPDEVKADTIEMDPAPTRDEVEEKKKEPDHRGSSTDAPDSKPEEVQRRKAKHNFEPDGRPDYGDASRSTFPQEWHGSKRIAMRDLPTNMCIYRVNKRTYYFSSALQMRGLYATILSVRRKAIMEYMDMSSLDADRCYVPHAFQPCIRHALELWWHTDIATEASSGWQNYLKLGCPGDRKLAERSYYKTWKHETFGKDWIFDLLLAFGDLDIGMLHALNESCDYRARVMQDPEFTPYVGPVSGPASTRVTTSLKRLSARGAAAQMGFPLPDVQGMTKTMSAAACARQDAMEIEEEVLAYEKYDLDLYSHTGEWTEEMAHIWADRRGVSDRAWEWAHRLSHDAGHNFTDRSGVWQKIAKESIVERAVRTYLEKNDWPQVLQMKKQYEGRPPKPSKRAGEKKAPQPKRAR